MQIVVSLDGSKLAEAVLPQAIALARATHNTITLLQAITSPSAFITSNTAIPENWYSENTAQSRDYLNAVAKGVQALDVETHIVTVYDDPATAILMYVEQHPDVSIIAMASHGRDGVGRWLLGSVATNIIHTLPKPLLLLHPDNNEKLQNRAIPAYHTIIVPLHESTSNDHVFDFAKPLATTFGATFTLVRVIQSSDEQIHTGQTSDYLENQAKLLRSEGFTVKTEDSFTDPVDFIQHLSETQRGEVLVIAAHRNKIEGVAMNFIHHVGVPVLLIPHH